MMIVVADQIESYYHNDALLGYQKKKLSNGGAKNWHLYYWLCIMPYTLIGRFSHHRPTDGEDLVL